MAAKVSLLALRWRAGVGHKRVLPEGRSRASQLLSLARLLKRTFGIDIQHCPNCGGGELKIIPAILGRPVIEKILTHLGVQARAPPRAPVRGQALQAA